MTYRMLLVVCLSLGLFSLCTCNTLLDKKCPQPPVQENFDKENFSGTWYHIERYLDDTQAKVLEFMICSTINYKLIDDKTVEVNNTFKTPVEGHGRDHTTRLSANAKIVNPKEPAKWIVYLQQSQDTSEYGSLADMDLNYWILDTDYNNYGLIWSCQSSGNQSLIDAIILSRKPTLDKIVLSDLHGRLDNYQLKPELFHSVNQTSCQY